MYHYSLSTTVVIINVERKGKMYVYDVLFMMLLAVVVTNQLSATEKHSQRILYKGYNQCK